MSNTPSLIGQSELRKDAWEKVAGEAKYTADITIPGMQFGAILRSPHHHARIQAIHTEEALKQPGISAVLTAADVPGSKIFGALIKDQPVLAQDVVRFQGEPVALVIAKSKTAAQKALESIRVDYELLPPVFDPQEAVLDGAPTVHPAGNLVVRFDVSDGDVDLGFGQADLVLEEVFSVQRISPGYLETENSLACWNSDDSITVWVSSQKPFEDRHEIACVLGLPEEKVQVKSAVIGGAFGGKEDSSIAVMTALGAWAIKGAFQLVNSRWESFLAHPKRHPAKMIYKVGVRKDGRLTALKVRVYLDTGAYASYGPAVGSLLTEMIPGPYRIPNVQAETLVCYTNSPISGAMRGFGSPQVHFAMESMMDMLADRLGLDPLELRKTNALHPGDRMYTRVIVDETAEGLLKSIQQVQEGRARLKAIPASEGKVSGVGFALAMQSMGLGAKVPDASTNRLEWLPDGSVTIYLGAPDLGQGLATVSEQMVAEELGIPFSMVKAAELDTSVSPNGGVSCASRMTYLVGNGLIQAAVQLKKSLLTQAAGMLKIPVQHLQYQRGKIVKADGVEFPASEFTSRAADNGVQISVETTATFEYPIEKTPQHLPIGMPHIRFVFGAQVVRVEVDPELGTVEVKDVIAIHDVGKIINRSAVEGQIEGGIAMGIGYALYENMPLKQNEQWVDSFTEYLLPTSKDMPAHLEVILLEVPEATGPYGAKGIGEIVLVPSAPAIANAVHDAVGVRVHEIPINPEALVLSKTGT
jgi:CO/xanthine dehydrogenase Mo-binding subunit